MVPWWLLLAAFILGFVLAANTWPPRVRVPRCQRIREYGLVWHQHLLPPIETTVALRCLLDKDHDGPHCVKLNEGRSNERLDWFEEKAPGCSGSASSSA